LTKEFYDASISDIERKLLLQKIGQKKEQKFGCQRPVKTLAAPFVVTSIA
jgi:hypothetical protein